MDNDQNTQEAAEETPQPTILTIKHDANGALTIDRSGPHRNDPVVLMGMARAAVRYLDQVYDAGLRKAEQRQAEGDVLGSIMSVMEMMRQARAPEPQEEEKGARFDA